MKRKRQKKILLLLESHNFLKVEELAEYFNVSTMTIRRDITELHEKNLIIKVHGGAEYKSNILTHQQKINRNIEEKNYIGCIMNDLINSEDVVFLGAGTTIAVAAKQLKKKNVYILTNNLQAFNQLDLMGFNNIYLTGGEYFSPTSEFIGEHCERIVYDFNIDISFLATNGILNSDVTTSKPSLARIQNLVLQSAQKNYLLADHSKFDVSDVYTFSRLDDFDGVITDNKIDQNIYNKYRKLTNIIN